METTAKQQRVHIDDLHFEHQRWISELKFFKDELKFYKNRLEEIAQRYTTTEVLKGLEHFQNQFYIQGNNLDELIHDLEQHEHELSKFAEANPIAVDHVLFEDHVPMRERVDTNRDIINDLKKEYQRYLAKWM